MAKGLLEISLLGAPEVRRDGRPAQAFFYRKSLALLAFLAVSGKSHSRSELAGLLWGDATEANARASLRKSLAELRKVARSNLLITRNEISFVREASHRLDVKIFDREARYCETDTINSLTPGSAARLAEAAALYRGEFMAGFHILRAPAFEEWVLLERERLRMAAIKVFYGLSIHLMTQGDVTEAIAIVERLLIIEPCHEEAHRLLMSLLVLNGQKAAALRQYQICCNALVDDLDLEPDEETTALYERIRSGLSVDADDGPIRTQLERPKLPLIGRRRELSEILSHLHSPHCRLLTLLGPGGSGKTHLAREIAAVYSSIMAEDDEQRENVYLIPLGFTRTIESLISSIALGSGYLFGQEAHPRQQLLAHLRHQRALLILDSCEGLLDLYEPGQGSFVDLVEDILDIAPEITILATTRARLNIPCEFLFPLAGMTYPNRIPENPNDLYGYDAVKLFLWRLSRVQPNHEPTEEDLLAIAEICRLAGGLPLEILLMANWARLITPAAITAQLSRELTHQPSDTIQKHPLLDYDGPPLREDLQRRLTPIFNHSWNLLPVAAQHTLATLSIFPGSFTYEAANKTTGVTPSSLMALQDQSLVIRIDTPSIDSTGVESTRYVVHDLLCELIWTKPDIAEALTDARERHTVYFIAELNRWADALHDHREQETLIIMDIEIANARAAWDWAIEEGRFDLIDLGIDGLCRFYQLRCRYLEGELACRTAVQALTAALPDQQRLLAKTQAWYAWFIPDHERALDLLRAALELLDGLPANGEACRDVRALALLIMGYRLLNTDHELSKEFFTESLTLFREMGDDWHAAFVLGHLHVQSWHSGEYDAGQKIAEESLALYQKTGYMSGYAAVLGDRGIAELQAGLIDAGMQSIEDSIPIFERLGNREGMAKGLYYRGLALGFAGNWEEADEQLQASASLGENRFGISDTALTSLAIVKTHRGQYGLARDIAYSGLEIAKLYNNQMCVGRALTALSLAALAEGISDEAEQFAKEAVTAYTDFNQKTELGMALAAQGYALCQRGDPIKAQTYFNEALSTASAHKDQLSLTYAFLGFAYLLSCLGQEAQAIENYTLASQHPFVAKSRWFDYVVKTQIFRAASNLSTEEVNESVRRGQAYDLEAMTKALMGE